MATLNGAVKVFIVERLACFERPVDVQAAVKAHFKVNVSFQQLSAYNPTGTAGAQLSKTLKELFEASRKKFLEDTSSIPIANKAYRLRMLDRMAGTLESKGNMALAAQLLEQAAKEEGGSYTNKQRLEHTGEGGGPMVFVKDYTGRG